MSERKYFSPLARGLHWIMALMILAMLFIGVAMVASTGPAYHRLVGLHRPLGIAILALAFLRLVNRVASGAPSLPTTLPQGIRLIAGSSQVALYLLMIALPLVGWAMLSAGDYPVSITGGVTLPPILSPDPALYASLRALHTWLALGLFGVILAHITGALVHGLLLRDGVFQAMLWRRPQVRTQIE
ncbi:cytochrome B561 [Acetobacter nitrogenifigens DSM 23921 = NBRC 105050]|uniref:Type-b cytochrome n=1 Tax=Acetobacter nitrogenifigens DSM 23921 = NBRC 105050 TaxID=1120919 RepID=A0A511XDD5_9PROT|nr:cytochrome b [Acetobacter nitrogenifigens]GBQ97172.1 cytochrome B561 [Acetobacter nitrogenifigens DSM 23921 = NBRC 105050]GEN60969.1 type-b cytochrome [Acetobacter nitrogenifigens DSM 23921 = NBRC 105050]